MFSAEHAWISSIEHLGRYQRLPWYKWLGILPGGFPQVRIAFQHFPLVYSAQGPLKLAEQLSFRAVPPPRTLMKSYSNLQDNLDFQLRCGDIARVEQHEMTDAAFSAYNLPFVRIQTTAGPLNDFLICVGGTNMSIIRMETEKLEAALRMFAGSKS